MKLRSLLSISAIAFSFQAGAQAWVQDSIEMGPGYGSDVFYSLKNGSQKVESNMNWHLAFQMVVPGPYGNVSVLANHVQTGVNVYPLHMSASTSFATLTPADTVGKTAPAQAMYNADTNWNFGAFNKMNDASNPADYSWGIYDQSTHDVNGDSLYLVTVSQGITTNAFKLWIQRFDSYPADSVHWEFRIAALDGTNDTTIKIYRKPDYTNRLFAYYDINTMAVTDREPADSAWDMVFTRYKEMIPGAPGVPFYSVMGVLTNNEVTVREMNHAGANDTTGFMGFAYSDDIHTIGSDWKEFDMAQTPPVWVIDDSTYYFVKTLKTDEYYQLQFTGFGGGANGKVIFRKRLLASIPVTGVNNIPAPVNAIALAPNPAGTQAGLMVDAKESVKDARLTLTDLTGRIVYSTGLVLHSGVNSLSINTGNLPSGLYLVNLSGSNWKVTEKLLVQH